MPPGGYSSIQFGISETIDPIFFEEKISPLPELAQEVYLVTPYR
jgi:hypothetical protein